jgi:hypothetical protein
VRLLPVPAQGLFPSPEGAGSAKENMTFTNWSSEGSVLGFGQKTSIYVLKYRADYAGLTSICHYDRQGRLKTPFSAALLPPELPVFGTRTFVRKYWT